jgi:hypothetical protein
VSAPGDLPPFSREPFEFWQLFRQLKATWVQGEIRLIDEQSGLALRRYQLNEDPEEGDHYQPLPI